MTGRTLQSRFPTRRQCRNNTTHIAANCQTIVTTTTNTTPLTSSSSQQRRSNTKPAPQFTPKWISTFFFFLRIINNSRIIREHTIAMMGLFYPLRCYITTRVPEQRPVELPTDHHLQRCRRVARCNKIAHIAQKNLIRITSLHERANRNVRTFSGFLEGRTGKAAVGV